MKRKLIIDDFSEQLDDLSPEVKQKAVEIASELLNEDASLSPSRAIQTAIPRAEQWYIDRAG
ncbi:hypothetical protein LEM8419_03443 [Neolewinella maritima]|uniref:Uncharacterized protein n=1 Tax=Neolewinella maritima TaxID=1383882 RepID=A0ABM9B6G3_9BACT|nr:hypothetical protein [Neolewinella maritima]CAH1002569.1 hypothetical protein LEM8419_03443 [Neolewinella maritima]